MILHFVNQKLYFKSKIHCAIIYSEIINEKIFLESSYTINCLTFHLLVVFGEDVFNCGKI